MLGTLEEAVGAADVDVAVSGAASAEDCAGVDSEDGEESEELLPHPASRPPQRQKTRAIREEKEREKRGTVMSQSESEGKFQPGIR
jgi:hypothetical protein